MQMRVDRLLKIAQLFVRPANQVITRRVPGFQSDGLLVIVQGFLESTLDEKRVPELSLNARFGREQLFSQLSFLECFAGTISHEQAISQDLVSSRTRDFGTGG